MVKIQTICRSKSEFSRETNMDLHKVYRNPAPNLHPFHQSREYTRALQSTKVSKIFSKPFLGALTGHSDGITILQKSPINLSHLISGSFDGEIRFWDISNRKSLFQLNAHQHMIKGLSFSRDAGCFLSTGEDKLINLYRLDDCFQKKFDPRTTFKSAIVINNVDHNFADPKLFCTSGQMVQIWNYERSMPIQSFEWGADSILKAKFNASETNLIVSTGIDRSIVLYDIRGSTPLKKVFLMNKSQCVSWNPQEPINFTVGNDDGNAYTFDMRKLESAKMIHKDHIKAIMDLDYAPTGKEFVTGSYDRTVRIFSIFEGKSREIFHGQRMQKVFAVSYSLDNQYVFSGSDDMNIRIWKSIAHKPLGTLGKREENSFNYKEKLKEKFKYNREINKIERHRHLPKYIMSAKAKKQIMKESKYRKIKNQEINNETIFKKPKPERMAKITDIQE